VRGLLGRLRGGVPFTAPDGTAPPIEAPKTGRAVLMERACGKGMVFRAGEVPVLRRAEVDRWAAEAMIGAGVEAVVGVGKFASESDGDRPNAGPAILARSGVRLLEGVGEGVFGLLRNGDEVAVRPDGLYRKGDLLAPGTLLGAAEAERRMLEGGEAVGAALEEVAQGTVDAMRRERGQLFRELDLPKGLASEIRGRHALVVARGHDYRRDLGALRAYVRDVRPYIIGVDGGADAVLEAGWRPDLVFGDLEAVSERALKEAGRVIVHGYAEGHAPGRERTTQAGLEEPPVLVALGLSEDVAILLAEQCGAGLIVAVGTHAGLTEFMDKSRKGVSSTFLTRLKFGPRLVDARAVSELYPARLSVGLLVGLMTAGLLSVSAVVLSSERVAGLFELVAIRLRILLGL